MKNNQIPLIVIGSIFTALGLLIAGLIANKTIPDFIGVSGVILFAMGCSLLGASINASAGAITIDSLKPGITVKFITVIPGRNEAVIDLSGKENATVSEENRQYLKGKSTGEMLSTILEGEKAIIALDEKGNKYFKFDS